MKHVENDMSWDPPAVRMAERILRLNTPKTASKRDRMVKRQERLVRCARARDYFSDEAEAHDVVLFRLRCINY